MSFLQAQIDSMSFGSVAPRTLIEGLHLTLDRGDRVALVGPSGAGKTTLLRILAGLEARYRGTIVLDGVPVVRPCARVQMVFQDQRLIPWKTVRENLLFACDSSDTQATVRVEDILERIHLRALSSRWPKELSGGEAARVAIGRAFVRSPSLMLLDEPFRGLDSPARIEVQRTLRELLHGSQCAVLLVSHDPYDALLTCRRVLVLRGPPLRIRLEVPSPDHTTSPYDSEIVRTAARITDELVGGP